MTREICLNEDDARSTLAAVIYTATQLAQMAQFASAATQYTVAAKLLEHLNQPAKATWARAQAAEMWDQWHGSQTIEQPMDGR